MKRFVVLLCREVKKLFFSKSALAFVLILSVMLGYGFYNAVKLYSLASINAISNLIYASGFEPVQGIFVPTFGTYFLIFSFFLPIVIIPSLSYELENNSLAILLQLPFSLKEILFAKLLSALLFVFVSLLMSLPIFLIWYTAGGHIPIPETLVLFGGYFLYATVVVSLSFFVVSLTTGFSSSAIFALLVVMISWLIDFGVQNTNSPLITTLSQWTWTHILKIFENGILSLSAVLYFLLFATFFMIMSNIFIYFKIFKLKNVLLVILLFSLGFFINSRIFIQSDITESHRNSYSTGVNKAIKNLPPIDIDVYLRKNDSRFRDYQESFLKKIRLLNKKIKVHMIRENKLGDNYGLFVYHINHQKKSTYSNSEEEIFPILSELSGIKIQKQDLFFKGYPLVVKNTVYHNIYLWFFILLPFICVISFIIYQFRGRYPKYEKN